MNQNEIGSGCIRLEQAFHCHGISDLHLCKMPTRGPKRCHVVAKKIKQMRPVTNSIEFLDLGSAKIPKKEVRSRIFADQGKWSACLAKIESGQEAWVKTWPEDNTEEREGSS
jgi:hypothetical protein